jgi:glycogen synthase
MKTLLLTNEYPPTIYGGAGIHIDYLSRELAKLCDVNVRCFGTQDLQNEHLSVKGYSGKTATFTAPKPLHSIFSSLQRCLDFNTTDIDADLVHCHTWYTHFAGILAKINYSIPLVITTHSLEPLRPWKREQLSGGYDFSCWVEKTALEMADAVIAVSRDTQNDIRKFFNIRPDRIHIIHNGIDLDEYKPSLAEDLLRARGIDPQAPFVLFVGRITRQKGILHLLNAIEHMDTGFPVILCAGAPDTPEIAKEVQDHISALRKKRDHIIWIPEMLDIKTKIALYSHAAVFCCPSIYEPFGIINLEAMACETPVVATAVGGIKEVVVDGETGFLVPFETAGSGSYEPEDPLKLSQNMAQKINLLMKDPDLRHKMGKNGRDRAEKHFSWSAVAHQTHALYQSLL